MASVDQRAPGDVTDRLLWRDAQLVLGQHAAAGRAGECEGCGSRWPCPPRRFAERAAAASRRPWREAWTARHELTSLKTLPSWRGERAGGDPAGQRPPRLPRDQPG